MYHRDLLLALTSTRNKNNSSHARFNYTELLSWRKRLSLLHSTNSFSCLGFLVDLDYGRKVSTVSYSWERRRATYSGPETSVHVSTDTASVLLICPNLPGPRVPEPRKDLKRRSLE